MYYLHQDIYLNLLIHYIFVINVNCIIFIINYYLISHWKKEDNNNKCPKCNNIINNKESTFNLLFPIKTGCVDDDSNINYLRPETCQEMYYLIIFINRFTNYLNFTSNFGYSIPFGIGQFGKSFRNEINPSNFLFRLREFNQFELEYFCDEKDSIKSFEYWKNEAYEFLLSIDLPKEKLRFFDHPKKDLAHYSKKTIDIEYKFPFGWKEILGISNRGNYDLTKHSEFSKRELQSKNTDGKVIIPTVIETSIGIERILV